jgi:hypothetical protein
VTERVAFWNNYRALRQMRREGWCWAHLRLLRRGLFGRADLIAIAIQSALEKDPQLLSRLSGDHDRVRS